MKVPFAGRKGDTSPPYGSNRYAKVIYWISCLLSTCRPKLNFVAFTTDDDRAFSNSERILHHPARSAREIRNNRISDASVRPAIDFYFPSPVRGLGQLSYGETVHRLHECGGCLRQGGQLEFCWHARARYITRVGISGITD